MDYRPFHLCIFSLCYRYVDTYTSYRLLKGRVFYFVRKYCYLRIGRRRLSHIQREGDGRGTHLTKCLKGVPGFRVETGI